MKNYLLTLFQRLQHAFHQVLFTIFFLIFLELYHWSLFGLNNAWHVVFDMKEVRIFRLLLIKNWSILRTTELSSNYLLSFDDAVTVSIYKSNYKTFLCSFLCLKLRPHHCHDYEIQLIFPPNGKCANSSNLPPKLILQPTVFSGNTNTHLVLNASLKFCLNLKFTQPNFFSFKNSLLIHHN